MYMCVHVCVSTWGHFGTRVLLLGNSASDIIIRTPQGVNKVKCMHCRNHESTNSKNDGEFDSHGVYS